MGSNIHEIIPSNLKPTYVGERKAMKKWFLKRIGFVTKPLLVSVFFILNGCATAPTQPPYVRHEYELLFKGNFGNEYWGGCIAAFHKGSFLYLVNSDHSNGFFGGDYHVTVYNPRIGLFTTLFIRSYGSENCTSINFPAAMSLFKGDRTPVNAIVSSSFRKLFDNVQQDPNALKNAISSGPSLFTHDGTWKGETTVVNPYYSLTGRNLDQLTAQLGAITTEEAAKMTGYRLQELQTASQTRQRERDEHIQREDAEKTAALKKIQNAAVGSEDFCQTMSEWNGSATDPRVNISCQLAGRGLTIKSMTSNGWIIVNSSLLGSTQATIGQISIYNFRFKKVK